MTTKQQQKDKALKVFDAIRGLAYQAYDAIVDPADKVFDAIVDPALKAYDAKCKEINEQEEQIEEQIMVINGKRYKLIEE